MLSELLKLLRYPLAELELFALLLKAVAVAVAVAVAIVGGGGGGPVGGGGDLMGLPLRLMRDEIEDDDIDEEDEVVWFEAAPMLLVTLTDLCGSLSKGLTRSCGSKLVTGL